MITFATILVFLLSLASIFFGFLILFKNRRLLRNIYLSFFIFNICGWSIAIGIMTINDNVIWPRFAFWFISAAFIFFTLFIREYLKNLININIYCFLIFIIIGLFFWSLSFTNLIITNVTSFKTSLYFTGVSLGLGKLYNPLLLYYLANFIYVIYLMIKGYLKSNLILRLQMKYFFIGIVAFTLLALMTNLILPRFGIFNFNNLGPAFSVIMISLMTYAITRYRLMDIRAIVFRTLTFGFIILVISGLYTALSILLTRYFTRLIGVRSDIVAGIIVATLIVIGYRPLRMTIESITNKFLYKKSYNPESLLTKIKEATSSILSLDQLSEIISDILVEAFHCEKIGMALVNKNKKLYVAYQEGFGKSEAKELVKGKERAMIVEFKKINDILVIDEMKTRYENREFKPYSPKILQELVDHDIALIIPLYFKDKLLGLMALGAKKSGDPYNQQDLRILNLVAGQVAISIQNAVLFEEQRRFAEILKAEVKKATAELLEAYKKVKHADESKSEFLSIAGHQLRTPLTVIKGYLSMILEGDFGEVPDKISHQIKVVFESNERLITLVRDLLNVSRIESGRQEYIWEKVDLNKLSQTIVSNMINQAGAKGLKLELAPSKVPEVIGDPNKLHEVMMNFIDNAIKYTERGEIKVFLKASPKNYITYSVKDTGMGISKENKERLFKKFSRGKNGFLAHTEGLGLGLYVAKLFIQAHEGNIWVDSKGEGKGSTFSFSIPIAGPKVKPGASKKLSIRSPEQLREEARK